MIYNSYKQFAYNTPFQRGSSPPGKVEHLFVKILGRPLNLFDWLTCLVGQSPGYRDIFREGHNCYSFLIIERERKTKFMLVNTRYNISDGSDIYETEK